MRLGTPLMCDGTRGQAIIDEVRIHLFHDGLFHCTVFMRAMCRSLVSKANLTYTFLWIGGSPGEASRGSISKGGRRAPQEALQGIVSLVSS